MPAQIKGPDCGVIDLIDHAVLAKQDEEIASGKGYMPLRPSASGYCARKLAYDYSAFKGHMEKMPDIKKPNIIRLLDLGQHVERAVIDQLHRAGIFKISYKQQSLHFMTLDDGTHIEGSPDVVLEFPDGSKGLYDVKSKNNKYSSWRDSSWDESLAKLSKYNSVTKISETAFYVDKIEDFFRECDDESLMQNIVQCNLYALNPFMQQRNVTFGGILRYNKNDSTMMELRFNLSQELYDYVLNKFKTIHENVTTPERVAKESTLGSMACAFCPYASKCWGNVNTKKPYFETLPKKEWATDTERMAFIGKKLDALQKEYDEAEGQANKLDKIKQEMLILMEEAGKNKIKTADGQVFEAKFLRSPKPHFELRKSRV